MTTAANTHYRHLPLPPHTTTHSLAATTTDPPPPSPPPPSPPPPTSTTTQSTSAELRQNRHASKRVREFYGQGPVRIIVNNHRSGFRILGDEFHFDIARFHRGEHLHRLKVFGLEFRSFLRGLSNDRAPCQQRRCLAPAPSNQNMWPSLGDSPACFLFHGLESTSNPLTANALPTPAARVVCTPVNLPYQDNR